MRGNTRILTIAHIVDYLMPTMGYQEFLLPKWNARHGHKVHIFTSDRYYPVSNYEETWGRFLGPRKCGAVVEQIDEVTVHRLRCLWEWKARHWLVGLEQSINELSPDVIFCHGSASPTAFRVAAFAKRVGIPVLMDNHMHFVAQNRSLLGRLYYAVLRAMSRRMLNSNIYRFLGVAQECCNFLQQEQGVPSHRIECLHFGVDTDLFQPDEAGRDRRRSEFRIPSDAKVILQTGKLTPDKSPLLLAQAMAKIMKQDSNVWLVFVGSGDRDYVDKIIAPISEQGVSARLLIIPFVPASDLAGIYNMADICVYPAGASLSCLEAAACGRAVIMADLPVGIWRAKHGVGICYRTGDVVDLRRRIDGLLSDSEHKRVLGKQASESVLNSFSYDAIARRSEDLMFEAIVRR